MTYTNTPVITSTTGLWSNANGISFSSINTIPNIPFNAQLEVERVFSSDRDGSTSVITNFLTDLNVKQSDKRELFLVPNSRLTINNQTKTITAINLPSTGDVYNFVYYKTNTPNVPETIKVPAIVDNSNITIRRKTVSNIPLISWVPGSKLTSSQLNLQTTQFLYLAQELLDRVFILTTTNYSLVFNLANNTVNTLQIIDGAVTPSKISTANTPWSFNGTVSVLAPTADANATTRLYSLNRLFEHGVMTKDDSAPSSSAIDILETAPTAGASGLWFNPKSGQLSAWAGNAWVAVAGTPVTTANLVSTNTVQTLTAAKTFAAGTVVPFTQTGTGAVARTVGAKLNEFISVKDFGAVGDGVTDDTTAIQAAIDAASGKIVVFPRGAYRINSTVNLPTAGITIDLGKSTILPYSTSRGLYRAAPTATATTTWSSGFTRGTTVLGVGSASGMAVGQWLVVEPVRTGNKNHEVAAHASKIVNISGTNITIADPLPMDYTDIATAEYLNIKTYTALHGDLQIANGSIDNRNSAASPAFPDYGVGLVVHGYENVLVENVEFIGPNITDNETRSPCAINGPSLNATVNQCRFHKFVHAGQVCIFFICNKAALTNSTIDGSGFGVTFIGCGYGEAASNYVIGRFRDEHRQGTLLSIRGIKARGCAQCAIQDNYVSEYDSATMIEYTESFLINGNYCINNTYHPPGGILLSSSGVTINSGNSHADKPTSCTITSNIVINSGGTGIFTMNPIDSIVVDGNIVRNALRYGIYVQGGKNAVVTNNSCYDCLQDTTVFFDDKAVITNQATRGVIDGNSVYSVANTKPAAVGSNVYTMIGMGNWSTTQRVRNLADPTQIGFIPQAINATVTGVVPINNNSDWQLPIALCGIGSLPTQDNLLTQANARAPTLAPSTHSSGAIHTSESLYFNLTGAAFFIVCVNNRSVLCFGDFNMAGISLIATGTADVFSNTIGTPNRINITKDSSSNQVRIQNGTVGPQSISICAFGCVPTSITVGP